MEEEGDCEIELRQTSSSVFFKMWFRRGGPWPSWPRWWRLRLTRLWRHPAPILLTGLMLVLLAPAAAALRCYVCGGHTGRPCEPIRGPGRRSPYVRPSPVPASDGSRQWETCDDIINNRGCIKQVVNDGEGTFKITLKTAYCR